VCFLFSCLRYLKKKKKKRKEKKKKMKEAYGVSGSPTGLFGTLIQILDHTFVSCYVDMNELDWSL
jgi:preprotein translocase subunit YajC